MLDRLVATINALALNQLQVNLNIVSGRVPYIPNCKAEIICGVAADRKVGTSSE